jgi:hypothetical protein
MKAAIVEEVRPRWYRSGMNIQQTDMRALLADMKATSARIEAKVGLLEIGVKARFQRLMLGIIIIGAGLCCCAALACHLGPVRNVASAATGLDAAVCTALAARDRLKAGSAPPFWVVMPDYSAPDALRAYLPDYAATAETAPFNRIAAIWAGWAAGFGAIAVLSQAAPTIARLF